MLDVARTLSGISCNNSTMTAASCSDAIARAIKMDQEAEDKCLFPPAGSSEGT